MPRRDTSGGRDPATALPWGLRVAAAASWRLLAIIAVLYVLAQLTGRLFALVMAMAIALLLAALLAPAVRWLTARRVNRTLAAAAVLVAGLAAVGGVLALVVTTVINGLPGLQGQIGTSLRSIHEWLRHGPLHLSESQLDQGFQQVMDTVRNSATVLTSGVLTTTGAVFGFLSSLLLMLFTLLFLLRDGRKIWNFTLRVTAPARVRPAIDRAGDRAFHSLVAYVRATAAVACMDAVGIGIGTAVVGVPLSPVLAALVFLGAFVPYVGAMATGGFAVLVALVANGPIPALIVLAIVVGVMQLEGHVLQPLILGHAVRLHPLAVLLSITAGFLLSGIAGAVLAVPITAVLNAAVRSFAAEARADALTAEPDGHSASAVPKGGPSPADPQETEETQQQAAQREDPPDRGQD